MSAFPKNLPVKLLGGFIGSLYGFIVSLHGFIVSLHGLIVSHPNFIASIHSYRLFTLMRIQLLT